MVFERIDAGDGVFVYLAELPGCYDEGFVEDNLRRLPGFRQEVCRRFRTEAGRRACILSWLLLSEGLREQYGIADPGEFIYNGSGKPYLKEYPHIFFNISHCKNAVCCALADFEIGVDVQDIRPYNSAVAKRVCSPAELRSLSAATDPARLFSKMWAKKESYAKSRGISVTSTFRQDLPETGFISRETENFWLLLKLCDPV